MTMAAVRGMGVAVMTSRSGSPSGTLGAQGRPLLDPEAVLLVDDHQPSEWNVTSSVSRAWVPTTRPTPPRRQALEHRPAPCP